MGAASGDAEFAAKASRSFWSETDQVALVTFLEVALYLRWFPKECSVEVDTVITGGSCALHWLPRVPMPYSLVLKRSVHPAAGALWIVLQPEASCGCESP